MITARREAADLDELPEVFVLWIGNLFTMFNQQLDAPSAKLYYRALADVPAPLLDEAITMALRDRVYPTVPRPADMRRYAEAARVELLARHPWTSCGACTAGGWVETEIDGVIRMTRCACVEQYGAQLRQLGAGGPSLTRGGLLPAGELERWQGQGLLPAGDLDGES